MKCDKKNCKNEVTDQTVYSVIIEDENFSRDFRVCSDCAMRIISMVDED